MEFFEKLIEHAARLLDTLEYPPLPTFFPRLNFNVLMAKYSCKWLKNIPGMILIPVGSRRKKVGMGG